MFDQLSLWPPLIQSHGAAAAPVQVPIDEMERIGALDPARSFIVQSPAGSGKTELLIQRYLTLLASASDPEAIVAITFTIKAASEMRERVVQALEAARGQEPAQPHERLTWRLAGAVLEQDQRRGWDLLRNTGRMRIHTIDALCMGITRQMPWMARMGAIPNVTDDAHLLYEQAAENTIRLLGESGPEASAVECLLRHLDYDINSARNLLASMLEIRDHWMWLVGARADPGRIRKALEDRLHEIVRAALRQLRDSVPADLHAELLEIARFAASNVEPDREVASCRELFSLPGDDPLCAASWHALATLLLTDKGEWRKIVTVKHGFPRTAPRMKDRFERLLQRLQAEAPFKAALDDLKSLPSHCYSEQQWEVLDALFTLLPRSVAELRLSFAARGIVDFIEISQAALHALGTDQNPTDLALALGCRIEHLLVDEFQDTSRAQYDLLRVLTSGWDDQDGRTLFLVGDPMQSIYRFRQADVGLYLTIRERGIGALYPEPVTLKVNFRSDKKIVDWLDSTFAAAFPPAENALYGGVPFSPSVAFRGGGGDSEGVHVHPFIGRQDEAEAEQVLRLIEQERASGASVAVLARARTHLIETANRLRRLGIRFRAIEIDSLGERPAVQDLLALTRALLHLADRPAWLAILRAPWCGLTLADLDTIAGQDHRSAIWDLLRDPQLTLTGDGAARLGHFMPVMGKALSRRGRMPLRTLVEGMWVRLGGPGCLTGQGDLADSTAYLKLLEGEERAGDLSDLDEFTRKVNQLFASPDPLAPDTLELMTIHRAKGLEFDCVIIPGIGRAPKRDDAKLLLWSEYAGPAGPEVLLAPISPRHAESDRIYRYLRSEERVKSDFETTRLLYVACTRARRSLHLIGHVDEKGKAEPGSFLSVLWGAIGDRFEGLKPSESVADPGRVSRPLRRLPLDSMYVMFSEGNPAPHSSGSAVPGVDRDESREMGILIHRFLEQIGKEGLAAWSETRIHGSRAIIEAGLAMSGIGIAEIAKASTVVEAALLRTLADPRARWIFETHQEARNEYAIAGVADGAVAHQRVDRTFIDEHGTRWIVDFKTGRFEEIHKKQIEAYAAFLRQIDSRPIRVGLYFPLTGEWMEPGC